jgi:hypothetical protein
MIEDLLQTLFSVRAALTILVLWSAIFFIRKVHHSREIAKLGARAPSLPSRLPIGKKKPSRLGKKKKKKQKNRIMEMMMTLGLTPPPKGKGGGDVYEYSK